MATPTLLPASQTSAVVLPNAATADEAAAAAFPFDQYTNNQYFLTGASDHQTKVALAQTFIIK